ncbi:hypothetical protein V9K67_02160 [Paraflavisolibacter sp. H34]|uniref:hypothetical protein n=1 Tax=Huijunlia imazamoxiresistens TaxID=3127457 RepID=UPI00301AECF4
MKKSVVITAVMGMGILAGKPFESAAQFSLNGQLRTRTEMRDGVGTLNAKGAKPAYFTSQRTRLNFGYKWDRLNFNFGLQDVRVWGQDASTINNADGGRLMVHEANAELTLMNVADTTIKTKLIDNLALKIGRQYLVYDDARLLGDLDWLQQGRRHDAAVLKAMHKGWQVDLGAGFNQNADAFGTAGTSYVPGNVPAYVTNSNGVLVAAPAGLLPLSPGGAVGASSSKGGAPVLANTVSTNGMNQAYKSMQFLYVSRKFGQTKVSGLVFKDDFAKYRLDSAGSAAGGYVYGRRYDVQGVNSRFTYGLMATGTIGNASGLKKTWTAGAYFQSGNNKEGQNLKTAHYTAALTMQKGKFSFGPGYDYLSGNDGTAPSATDNRFDPLYGTPHKFWGFMDYYYVGTGSPAGGLQNAYIKTRYTAKDLFITLDAHRFDLADKTINTLSSNKAQLDKHLGYEFDLVANYTLNKFTEIQAGYSYMVANNSTEFVKKGTMDKTNQRPQWAFVMINIRPDFFFTKPVAIRP